MLNSRLLNWCFRVFSTNNNVSIAELAPLPIPRVDFLTAPGHRRAVLAEERHLYDIGHYDGLLSCIGARLGSDPGEKHVVHDLLAYLAERMIDMNRQKQREANSFLDWLASYAGLPIEDWRLKTIAKVYWEHPWHDLQRALRQNRKAIKEASGRDVEGREAQETIQREFEKSMATLKPLVERIEKTDRLIDLIVYRLYGLTEEEVAIVEENVGR